MKSFLVLLLVVCFAVVRSLPTYSPQYKDNDCNHEDHKGHAASCITEEPPRTHQEGIANKVVRSMHPSSGGNAASKTDSQISSKEKETALGSLPFTHSSDNTPAHVTNIPHDSHDGFHHAKVHSTSHSPPTPHEAPLFVHGTGDVNHHELPQGHLHLLHGTGPAHHGTSHGAPSVGHASAHSGTHEFPLGNGQAVPLGAAHNGFHPGLAHGSSHGYHPGHSLGPGNGAVHGGIHPSHHGSGYGSIHDSIHGSAHGFGSMHRPFHASAHGNLHGHAHGYTHGSSHGRIHWIPHGIGQGVPQAQGEWHFGFGDGTGPAHEGGQGYQPVGPHGCDCSYAHGYARGGMHGLVHGSVHGYMHGPVNGYGHGSMKGGLHGGLSDSDHGSDHVTSNGPAQGPSHDDDDDDDDEDYDAMGFPHAWDDVDFVEYFAAEHQDNDNEPNPPHQNEAHHSNHPNTGPSHPLRSHGY